ncbi:MAG: helix-turn-helix domain-containing protein [Propionibacteriaceae bacterium]|nr:helix-turn-helix domain-containing protein [Propionibacteriaceae bacterium]
MKPMLVREALGAALRDLRVDRGFTLREVASSALVSVGYLSELERGLKEASSELLSGICEALGTTEANVLAMASAKLAIASARDNVVPLFERKAA